MENTKREKLIKLRKRSVNIQILIHKEQDENKKWKFIKRWIKILDEFQRKIK